MLSLIKVIIFDLHKNQNVINSHTKLMHIAYWMRRVIPNKSYMRIII